MARDRRFPSSRPKIKSWLRRDVFTRDGFTCRACGWRPDTIPVDYDGKSTIKQFVGVETRKRTLLGGTRRWVAAEIYRHLELDHIIPWSLGGPESAENFQTLCNTCNSKRGARG